ncbi:MAG: LysM peptidoglycan-binding domain-containing protein [Salinivirgaceae bacterium]|nr:LysM peptidoglycan-binding domain-containing protein [Salinivirgaceae bacterium]
MQSIALSNNLTANKLWNANHLSSTVLFTRLLPTLILKQGAPYMI